MSKFEESNFYKALQDFFINADKKTFLQFLAEFYNRTEGIIDKDNIQDDLIKELRELYIKFNEEGIDENIVREKVNYFLENSAKIQNIISKLTINTNNIKNITSQLDTIENKLVFFVEDFGAVGDGVSDDSNAILNAINTIASKYSSATLHLNKNYLINSEIVLDFNYKKINFIVDGQLTCNKTITINHPYQSKIQIYLREGGNNSLDSYGIIFNRAIGCDLDLHATDFNGTAFKIGGVQDNTNPSDCTMCNVKVWGQSNIRTLEHGSNIDRKIQSAFGTYTLIHDSNPTNGILFQNSNDITILHVENWFNDITNTKDSISFIKCDMIHCSSFACGGKARNIGYIKDSGITFDKVFVMGEEFTSPRKTNGLQIEGSSRVDINNIYNNGCLYAIRGENLVNTSTYNYYISVKNASSLNTVEDNLIYVPQYSEYFRQNSMDTRNYISSTTLLNINNDDESEKVKIWNLVNNFDYCSKNNFTITVNAWDSTLTNNVVIPTYYMVTNVTSKNSGYQIWIGKRNDGQFVNSNFIYIRYKSKGSFTPFFSIKAQSSNTYDDIILKDSATNKKYNLSVENGQLKITEKQ